MDAPKIEIKNIEKALCTLLSQIMRIDRAASKRAEGKPIFSKLVLVSAAEIVPITRRQSQIQRVVENPVRGACINAIRFLGERIFELTGDTHVMAEVCDHVASHSGGRHSQYRANIIVKTWDGIGCTKDKIGWVA
jgi:hypothetical protein